MTNSPFVFRRLLLVGGVFFFSLAVAETSDTAKRQQLLAKMHEGPECSGQWCFSSSGDANRVAVLYSDSKYKYHFRAPVTINGKTVIGLIDTGASSLAMSAETAKLFGIASNNGKRTEALTANGQITTSSVIVPSLDVAGIKFRNVPASIGITGDVLIGMSVLSQLKMSMEGDTLTLRKRN